MEFARNYQRLDTAWSLPSLKIIDGSNYNLLPVVLTGLSLQKKRDPPIKKNSKKTLETYKQKSDRVFSFRLFLWGGGRQDEATGK